MTSTTISKPIDFAAVARLWGVDPVVRQAVDAADVATAQELPAVLLAMAHSERVLGAPHKGTTSPWKWGGASQVEKASGAPVFIVMLQYPSNVPADHKRRYAVVNPADNQVSFVRQDRDEITELKGPFPLPSGSRFVDGAYSPGQMWTLQRADSNTRPTPEATKSTNAVVQGRVREMVDAQQPVRAPVARTSPLQAVHGMRGEPAQLPAAGFAALQEITELLQLMSAGLPVEGEQLSRVAGEVRHAYRQLSQEGIDGTNAPMTTALLLAVVKLERFSSLADEIGQAVSASRKVPNAYLQKALTLSTAVQSLTTPTAPAGSIFTRAPIAHGDYQRAVDALPSIAVTFLAAGADEGKLVSLGHRAAKLGESLASVRAAIVDLLVTTDASASAELQAAIEQLRTGLLAIADAAFAASRGRPEAQQAFSQALQSAVEGRERADAAINAAVSGRMRAPTSERLPPRDGKPTTTGSSLAIQGSLARLGYALGHSDGYGRMPHGTLLGSRGSLGIFVEKPDTPGKLWGTNAVAADMVGRVIITEHEWVFHGYGKSDFDKIEQELRPLAKEHGVAMVAKLVNDNSIREKGG